ncbi:uncharacterized protein LOC118512813 isoform X1 [Anopheles stephensi]|uniref:uncharacterized protein LOC118512813 isoform X1 n=1 Tax=Anopheles stephensi TaxID=30069 RepID=UPI001658921C|nr:uncharacterized protein LOC118512813 isoform X1 [Anopheles stephensi]
MSYSTVVLALVCCAVGLSVAYPYPYPQNAFMYYRNAYPMMTYPQLQQSAMYQHAIYQNQRLRNYHRRSATSGVAAFASGDNIATGTQIVKADCRPADPAVAAFPSVQSFADAYPAEAVPENEIPFSDEGALDQDSNVGTELDFPLENEEPLEDIPASVPLAVPTTVTDKRKKKVTVQLDSASAEDDQEDEEVSFGTRRGSGSRPSAGGSGGPMFPVTFGSTNGGAIAIANSYSTGKGGSATSHATAYGSPASVPEERRRAVVLQQQRNNRPAKLRTIKY